MKILSLDAGFPPELASGHLAYEFARELVKRDHSVTVVTVFPRRYLTVQKMRNSRKFFYWEEMEGVRVMRVQPEFSHKALCARAIEHLIVPISLFFGGLLAGKNDVILCGSPPLFAAFAAALLGKIKRVPVIARFQDIHPDALVKLGILKNSLAIGVLELIERFIYKSVGHMTVISEGCKKLVLSKGINQEKIDLIPNWADTKKISPSTKPEDLRREYDLLDKFVVTYAGIMSWPQDLETIVESANLLRDHKDIQFLLVGEGAQKKLLKEKIEKLNLENVKLLPLQPRETYFKILQASDACLVSLKKSYTSPTVPSKMLDIMACSKPIIANVPYENDVHRIIEQANCGIWVEPENPEALKQVILTLYKNQKLRKESGKRGRKYVETHLSLTVCVDQYEDLISRLLLKRHRKYKHLIVFIRSNPIAPDPRVEKEVWFLANHGFKVTILAWDREKAFSKIESFGNKTICRLRLGAPYKKMSLVAYYPLFWLWVLLRLLRIRPLIVHACDIDSVFPAFLYRLLIRKTKVIFDVFDSYALLVRLRSKILSGMLLRLELLAASMSDAFITVSSQQLALFGAAKPKLIEIVMNSPPPILDSKILSECTKHTKFRIVYAGSVSEDRGLLQLSEATKDIDDLELIIAGRVNNRNTLAKINQFSHAHYVGQLNYEQALQLQASADLIPALYDPKEPINRIAMPNKIFEAMMLGVPIITNLPYVIKETKCGVIVNYHDINAIKQAILYIREHPEAKLQLGLNGKRAFEQKFNWSHMERRLLGLYDELISSK